MAVDNAREQDGESLSHCHNDNEGDGTKLRYREEDEELSHGGTHRQQQHVRGELRMSTDEGERGGQGALLQQGGEGQEAGPQVRADHHLERGDVVALEEGILPVGSERVEHHVADEKENTTHRSHGARVPCFCAAQQEDGNTTTDHA